MERFLYSNSSRQLKPTSVNQLGWVSTHSAYLDLIGPHTHGGASFSRVQGGDFRLESYTFMISARETIKTD